MFTKFNRMHSALFSSPARHLSSLLARLTRHFSPHQLGSSHSALLISLATSDSALLISQARQPANAASVLRVASSNK